MYIIEPVGFTYACISVRADGSAACAHAVVGSRGRYGSALHMLSSGSSVHVTARSVYSHVRVFIDRRLRTDQPWDVQYIRARGHECLCVRARARVDLAVWVHMCESIYSDRHVRYSIDRWMLS